MSSQLVIRDSGTLHALLRALLEVRFRLDLADEALGTSPFLAELTNEVLQAVIADLAEGDARRKISHNAARMLELYRDLETSDAALMIVREKLARCEPWEEWSSDARSAYVTQLAAPYGLTEALRERLVAERTACSKSQQVDADVANQAEFVAFLRAGVRRGRLPFESAQLFDALADALDGKPDVSSWAVFARILRNFEGNQPGR